MFATDAIPHPVVSSCITDFSTVLSLIHNAKNKRRPDRGVRWTAARPGTNLIDLLNVVTPFAMLTHPIVLKPWHVVRHPNMGLRLQTGIIVQSGYPNNYVWLCRPLGDQMRTTAFAEVAQFARR